MEKARENWCHFHLFPIRPNGFSFVQFTFQFKGATCVACVSRGQARLSDSLLECEGVSKQFVVCVAGKL